MYRGLGYNTRRAPISETIFGIIIKFYRNIHSIHVCMYVYIYIKCNVPLLAVGTIRRSEVRKAFSKTRPRMTVGRSIYGQSYSYGKWVDLVVCVGRLPTLPLCDVITASNEHAENVALYGYIHKYAFRFLYIISIPISVL